GVSIDFPMVLPTQRGVSAPAAVPALTLPPLQQTTATVSTAQLPQLQLALQVPNVSVSGLLLRVEDQELEDRFLIPSIPAAIIIPGNIAFLNQFFSGLLMVSNVAPGQSHLDQIKITGTLDGRPIGPVKISGSATGVVEVRNPTFALTLSHPATVTAGEEYDFNVIVTNTSETPANFVNLSLLPRSISGAV